MEIKVDSKVDFLQELLTSDKKDNENYVEYRWRKD